MSGTAFVFPGQGAQYVGMGLELAQGHPRFAGYFEEAGAALGLDLAELCFRGSEARLQETANTQPAILTMSVACAALLTEHGLHPDMVAGLSLGEYSALVTAGSLDFVDAVRLVRQRGLFMQEAVPLGEGGMAAIIGLETEKIEEICRDVREIGWVEPANYNCPGQVVVAGAVRAVAAVSQKAAAAGAAKTVLLPVSAPFHCRLLEPAGERLAAALADVQIRPARVPLVANVTAEPIEGPEAIRQNLIAQVSSPVRWEQSIRHMLAAGIETFVEVGPGRTLSGFIKRIHRKARILNIEDSQTLDRVLDSIGRVC